MNIPLKSRIARRLFSLLPRAGLVPPPSRPQGISAIMRVWNENTWLEDSIGSVKDFVDEIVAVDTGSTDGSLETLKKIALSEKKLKVFSFAGKAPWGFSNFAIERTNYRWIMKWDPDFIATPGGEGGLAGFTAYLRALNPRMYYYLSSKFIEVAGDFRHQFPGLRVRGDIETFTYSEGARYIQVARTAVRSPYPVKLPPGYCPKSFSLRLEGVKLPFYYRILSFDRIVGYHVNVKPALRQLLGYFYLQWLGSENFAKEQGLEVYALEQVRARWGFGDLHSAAEFYMGEYAKLLSPYDNSLGELPENMKALAARPGFELIHRSGKPAGRQD